MLFCVPWLLFSTPLDFLGPIALFNYFVINITSGIRIFQKINSIMSQLTQWMYVSDAYNYAWWAASIEDFLINHCLLHYMMEARLYYFFFDFWDYPPCYGLTSCLNQAFKDTRGYLRDYAHIYDQNSMGNDNHILVIVEVITVLLLIDSLVFLIMIAFSQLICWSVEIWVLFTLVDQLTQSLNQILIMIMSIWTNQHSYNHVQFIAKTLVAIVIALYIQGNKGY